jgi:hypothetical protein
MSWTLVFAAKLRPTTNAITLVAGITLACVIVGLIALTAGLVTYLICELMPLVALVGGSLDKLFSQLFCNTWTLLTMNLKLSLWYQNSLTVGARTVKLNLFKGEIGYLHLVLIIAITAHAIFKEFESASLTELFLASSLTYE